MIWRPRNGQRVELRYKKSMRPHCPHGAHGVVLKAGTGKIINALVMLDSGEQMIVPRGNLFPEKQLDLLSQTNPIEDAPPPRPKRRDKRPLHKKIRERAQSGYPTSPEMEEWADEAEQLAKG